MKTKLRYTGMQPETRSQDIAAALGVADVTGRCASLIAALSGATAAQVAEVRRIVYSDRVYGAHLSMDLATALAQLDDLHDCYNNVD